MELWSLTKPTLAIVLFLVIVKTLVFRERIPNTWMFAAAVLLTVVGLYLFSMPVDCLVGLEYRDTTE